MPARIEDLDAALYNALLSGLQRRLARMQAANAQQEPLSEADDTSMSHKPLERVGKQTNK